MLENKERDHKLTEIATNVDIFLWSKLCFGM